MSSRHPEPGAGHPDNFDDRGDADRLCDYCAKTIYSGSLRQVTIGRSISLLCPTCWERQQDEYVAMTHRDRGRLSDEPSYNLIDRGAAA